MEDTSCSLNIVFFRRFLYIFLTLAYLGFPLDASVCTLDTMAGQTSALQQNWQSSEKSQHFKENKQYLMNTLYLQIAIVNRNEKAGKMAALCCSTT